MRANDATYGIGNIANQKRYISSFTGRLFAPRLASRLLPVKYRSRPRRGSLSPFFLDVRTKRRAEVRRFSRAQGGIPLRASTSFRRRAFRSPSTGTSITPDRHLTPRCRCSGSDVSDRSPLLVAAQDIPASRCQTHDRFE